MPGGHFLQLPFASQQLLDAVPQLPLEQFASAQFPPGQFEFLQQMQLLSLHMPFWLHGHSCLFLWGLFGSHWHFSTCFPVFGSIGSCACFVSGLAVGAGVI